MYLGKADVNTYEKGAEREFLISNGRGSYGFSTVIGTNTRREHGLLVIRPDGAQEHSVLVSKLEETVYAGKNKYQLSTNRYKDLVYPDGYRYLQEYQSNPYPTMLFVIHGILLRKSIIMPQGKARTVLKYELLAAPEKIRLDLRPLFAHRLASELLTEHNKSDFKAEVKSTGLLEVTGLARKSYCYSTSGKWTFKPIWFENIIYERDDNVNSMSLDYLWSPGVLSCDMEEGDGSVIYVVLSDNGAIPSQTELAEMEKNAISRFEKILKQSNLPAPSSAEQDMIASSYHLIDNRDNPVSPIYSGYPSVEYKARDTFVSLPGLALATGREDIAKATLNFWADVFENNGRVMPEKIDSNGGYVTGGVDNGLWFVYAADKYISHVGNAKGYADLFAAMKSITDKYFEGIKELDTTLADNGLLYVNTNSPSRHWMNAIAGSEYVVSRQGFLVEVNALWYNALRAMEKHAAAMEYKELKAVYAKAAKKVEKSFINVFWSKELNGLYDWVDIGKAPLDPAVRPNQILAASLPNTPLTDEMARGVINLCWNELYTTYGLRTLAPKHSKFKGRAEGRVDQKLKAFFRGMAWPWLLGEFISAYLKYNPTRKDLGWIFMRPFSSHLRHGCLGGVAECFDGMMPYKPHGDVLNAMALGELLRVLHENFQED